MVHPSLQSEDGPAPLLAVSEPGEGRVMMLTTDSLWLTRFETPLQGGPVDAWADFWKNAISWLSKDPEMNPLQLSTHVIESGAQTVAQIDAEVRNVQWQADPMRPVTFEISWRDEEGSRQSQTLDARTDSSGRISVRWSPVTAGPHQVLATTKDGRRNVGRFISRRGTVELDHLDPDPLFLQRLSELTGGAAMTDDIFPERLVQRNPTESRQQISEVPLWSHPATFALFMLLLVIEWTARRRQGID
jgi:hypothetical protein